MSLDRFKTAQGSPDAGFATAIAELRAGRKTSHWVWYIFPQLAELGHSSTARFYGVHDLAEACDYVRDALLRERLALVTRTVVEQLSRGTPIAELMGGMVDSAKLVSSMTLFHIAARKLAESSSLPDYAALADLCDAALAAAGRQGFPACTITRSRCDDAELR